MGRLITLIGNSGTGKTSLTRKLCELGSFYPLLEQHQQRPFQKHFSDDLTRYALANQIDYLLFRAEQELYVRTNDVTGVQDGGLDLDFQAFTRLFFKKGYLDTQEFGLCERLVSTLRQTLPPPDLVVSLSAPKEVLVERMLRRNRSLEIARFQDLDELEALIRSWVAGLPPAQVLHFDTSPDDPATATLAAGLLLRVNARLADSRPANP